MTVYLFLFFLEFVFSCEKKLKYIFNCNILNHADVSSYSLIFFHTQVSQSTLAMKAKRMLTSSCGTQWTLCKGPVYLKPRECDFNFYGEKLKLRLFSKRLQGLKLCPVLKKGQRLL